MLKDHWTDSLTWQVLEVLPHLKIHTPPHARRFNVAYMVKKILRPFTQDKVQMLFLDSICSSASWFGKIFIRFYLCKHHVQFSCRRAGMGSYWFFMLEQIFPFQHSFCSHASPPHIHSWPKTLKALHRGTFLQSCMYSEC